MFILTTSTYILAALCLAPVSGHKHHRRQDDSVPLVVSESVIPITGGQAIPTPTADPAPLVTVAAGRVKIETNTTLADSNDVAAADTIAETVKSTALVIARDSPSAYSAYSALNDYGIPYEVLIVPSSGAPLPSLNSTATDGNYGLIIILSEVSYYYPTANTYQSALTSPQWAALFSYQITFGVRMVRLDVYPSADTGTVALGDCCGNGVEQFISVSNDAEFQTAGLRVGAQLTTAGLYHYPAAITNSTIATEAVQFAPNSQFSTTSTAAVINNIGGRQQMVFFIGFATDWSLTSNYLSHAWLTWATRGLYTGYRRTLFLTQIDDMFLESDIYSPAGNTYRIAAADLANHIVFTDTINAKLNAGSEWWIEIGHNGNGNIEASDASDDTGDLCVPGPIEYDEQIDTPLEFQKPLGTGKSIWPATAGTYPNYPIACLTRDPLLVWFATPSNLNAFSHVSHTFTHEDQNNASYSDIFKEINWNQNWLAASGIAAAQRFSPSGLIPPAITGLHNGDALQAWSDNGIIHAVGDNTRPALLNKDNEHWPLITTVAANGFAGIQITPRWATNIYYNCDNPGCTVLEWINTSGGKGDINTLLEVEKQTNVRHLLELHHDPFMFHQANLRYDNAASYTINGVTSRLSLFQAWVETVTQEFVRLVKWPLVTKKHDDVAATFMSRMRRDACGASLSYIIDSSTESITGFTVSTANTCSEAIPVTIPGSVTDTQGFRTEQLGSDPLTIWVTGSPVSFTLTTPIRL